MVNWNFNAADYEETSFKPIPVGDYRVRIAEAEERGWFPDDASKVLNETNIIDVDGSLYRPDRVVLNNGEVTIIDYKSGEHDRRYERQMTR